MRGDIARKSPADAAHFRTIRKMSCILSADKVEKWPGSLPEEVYWHTFTNSNRENAPTVINPLPKPPAGIGITSNPDTSAARIRRIIWCCCTPIVTIPYTTSACMLQNPRHRRCAAHTETGPASETSEPYEVKVSRTIKMQVDFLESATFKKVDGQWKMKFLHSTVRK
jgi:hypothetical protein